jgi:hypothetical protein
MIGSEIERRSYNGNDNRTNVSHGFDKAKSLLSSVLTSYKQTNGAYGG